MRTDEIHKFSDGTLNHVRTTLNDIDLGIEMAYFPKRKWSKQDKQRACVMINATNKKLKDKRLMKSLEKFAGGRPMATGKDHMIYHMLFSYLRISNVLDPGDKFPNLPKEFGLDLDAFFEELVDLDSLFFGSFDDSASLPDLLLFDPQFNPAKGFLSLS
uniref:Uncharacterized protein n=1 Tax=Tanacetum cinerariifolium TaxID=118510 RepID=A0A699JLN0_TANCI|nr:hypothetical protein [Tanacetum cinerariifolium]